MMLNNTESTHFNGYGSGNATENAWGIIMTSMMNVFLDKYHGETSYHQYDQLESHVKNISFLPLRLQRRSEGGIEYYVQDLNLKRDVYLLYGLIALLIRISVGLLGLVGNTFSLVVWSRPHLKSPSSVILLVLAVSDTLVILCGVWIDLPKAYRFLGHYKGNLKLDYIELKFTINYYTVWSTLVIRAVYFMAATASMYLTLLLTVERSVCIFHPFRFEEWCSYTRTCKFVLAVVIFSILCNLGKLCWQHRVIGFNRVILDGEEFTVYKEVDTELYHNPIYEKVVLVWMAIVLKYLVPLTCIVTLNAITYIKLKKVNKERLTMTEAQKNENKLTRMIIYVVLEFIVFTSYNGLAGLSTSSPSLRIPFDSPGQLYLFYEFRELLNSLNSSVNFITYFISWPPFRRTFVKIFGCKKEVVQTSPPPRPRIHQTSV